MSDSAGSGVRVLSLGAGVQSTTVLLMSFEGEIAPYDVVIFADTQAEPQTVYDHLDRLEVFARNRGTEIVRVTTGNLTADLLNPAKRDGMMIPAFVAVPTQTRVPGTGTTCSACHGAGSTWDEEDEDEDDRMPERCELCEGVGSFGAQFETTMTPTAPLRRQCTDKYKSRPIYRWLDTYRNGKPVILGMGISLDEVHRMKPPKRRWVTNEYPLIDARMDRDACKRWMGAHGWTAPRSACTYCPYHSNHEWRRLRDEDPNGWAEAVRVDTEMRSTAAGRREAGTSALRGIPFVHRSLVPLPMVDLSTPEDHGQGDLFGNECEGMCGV